MIPSYLCDSSKCFKLSNRCYPLENLEMMDIVWDAKQDLLAIGHGHALPKWFEL